ncbi:MAG: hypothetical protein GY707_07615 [Desulfobacteraceae bacterium]|nr:hypothetical protein [Desulfobacteraceae bacterium]
MSDYVLSLIIAFGGPALILTTFLLFFGTKLTGVKKLVIVIVIYIFSIATGSATDVFWNVSNIFAGVIAGVVSPTLYCSLIFLLNQRNHSKTINIEETIDPTNKPRKAGWDPIIIAAFIQAIASIIIAIIMKL